MSVRPLVVRFGAMGDMVMVLALVHALHRRYGSPVDIVSSGAWTRPLIERQPGVGTLHLIRSRKTPYFVSPQQVRLVDTLRKRGATPTWICDSDDKCRWLIARAGIPQSLIVDVRSYPFLPGEHTVDRWIRIAQATPPALKDAPIAPAFDAAFKAPPLKVDETWRTELDRWLDSNGLARRPLVLIQAGNRRAAKWGRPRRRASNTKYWPDERWARVIDALAQLEPDAEILLTGVSTESQVNEAILRHTATSRARNIARDLPLPRLLALQERAIGMISVDTGPAHSAAALGCPMVVLFGTADPMLFTPRSPIDAVVSLRGETAGRLSMLAIGVDDVVGAWRELRRSHAAATWPRPGMRGASGCRADRVG